MAARGPGGKPRRDDERRERANEKSGCTAPAPNTTTATSVDQRLLLRLLLPLRFALPLPMLLLARALPCWPDDVPA